MALTAGVSKELKLSSTTVQLIAEEYVTRRVQFKKAKLNWRSGKKSLGWIPFKAGGIHVDFDNEVATYRGLSFKFWNSRTSTASNSFWNKDFPAGEIKSGSINCDAQGHWYLNLVCKTEEELPLDEPAVVGIDLGLKDALTLSTGQTIAAQRYYRSFEDKLAKAQRAKKKKQVRKIHAKIKNKRKDFNHKVTTSIANSFSSIYVGDVKSQDLASTNMAKSVYDVGWFQLKTFLKYKALARKSTYLETREAYSTQTCSVCWRIPTSSPRGIQGLSVREWTCSSCGAKHQRDVNAARNILRFGHESLPESGFNEDLILTGIPGLKSGEDVKSCPGSC